MTDVFIELKQVYSRYFEELTRNNQRNDWPVKADLYKSMKLLSLANNIVPTLFKKSTFMQIAVIGMLKKALSLVDFRYPSGRAEWKPIMYLLHQLSQLAPKTLPGYENVWKSAADAFIKTLDHPDSREGWPIVLFSNIPLGDIEKTVLYESGIIDCVCSYIDKLMGLVPVKQLRKSGAAVA